METKIQFLCQGQNRSFLGSGKSVIYLKIRGISVINLFLGTKMQLKLARGPCWKGSNYNYPKSPGQSVILETFFLGAFERFKKSLIMTLEIKMKPHDNVRDKMKDHDDVKDKIRKDLIRFDLDKIWNDCRRF